MSPANQALAAQICKSTIAKYATTLTADEKAKLNHLCDLAGTGNTAAIKAAARQICLTVIKDSAPGLSGAALSAADAACNKTGVPTG